MKQLFKGAAIVLSAAVFSMCLYTAPSAFAQAQTTDQTVTHRVSYPVNPNYLTIKKYTYNSKTKTITFKGTAKGARKVAVRYGSKTKKVNVTKKGAFTAKYKFKGYKAFTLWGTNARGKQVTAKKKISSAKYATESPDLAGARGTKKGIMYIFDSAAGSYATVLCKGKVVAETPVDASQATIYVKRSKLHGYKGQLRLVQKETGKKTSKSCVLSYLKAGESYQVSY